MSLVGSSLFNIAGKTAVVTGGGRGIGLMIASALVANGAKVYITSRNADACKEAAGVLSEKGPGSCVALSHDLSDVKGIQNFAKELAEMEPCVNILVNNSGTTWGEPIETYPEAAFDRVFRLNVTAPFSLTRALLSLLTKPATSEDPSRVINIGSIAGLAPQPVPTFAYDASKAALHHLTKKLATELAPRHITVNAIAPGFVPSKMSKQLLTYATKEQIEKAIPLGRWGTAEDLGGATIFLSSRAGAWITGAILPVDGGSVAKPIGMIEE